jgi:DNA-binding FadR family transcriptional regulator
MLEIGGAKVVTPLPDDHHQSIKQQFFDCLREVTEGTAKRSQKIRCPERELAVTFKVSRPTLRLATSFLLSCERLIC